MDNTISTKQIKEVREFLSEVLKEVRDDSNLQRGTFADNKFELEQTIWNAIHLLGDLQDYWHMTGKVNKFDKD